MTRPAVIEIRELWKTYQLGEVEVHALRGVSLRVESGEFVAVMGASGSGKSTLMNIVGCLDRPTQGSYLLEGEDVAELPEETLATIRGRKIGFVFQNFNLLARTSALENVELPLFYSAWSGAGERRAEDLMKMLGLDGREANHPNQLSGGQQQRVAIGRALATKPMLLLADEPTGNLDEDTADGVLALARDLVARTGCGFLMVTHSARLAATLDRQVTLHAGRVT
jgi:ABC-type lipoprotein export system ATPase subunit